MQKKYEVIHLNTCILATEGPKAKSNDCYDNVL